MRSEPIHPDTALIRDCQSGNKEAFATLVERHRNGVYNFVRHTVGIEADAQDIVQDIFICVFSALPRFRAGAPFEPWIYKIAANACRSYFRKQRYRTRMLDSDYANTLIEPSHSADPIATMMERDRNKRLLSAVQNLPPEQRMVIVLKHLQDCSYQDISKMLGIPVSTVEHRLRAARLVLRRVMDDCERGGSR